LSDTRRKTILICDDQPSTERIWENRLKGVPGLADHFNIEVMEPKELLKATKGLEQRRSKARDQKSQKIVSENDENALEKIDTASVLILDYDLLELAAEYYQTGEEIAYLARCYSTCSLIIALNQFDHGSIAFDLRMTGHLESFADLNVGDPALSIKGIWDPKWMLSEEGFRPWAWPLIPQAIEKYERRVREIVAKLDEPILTHLQFPEDVIDSMSRTVLEFITASDDPMKTTFRMFAESAEKGLGKGLRRKDRAPSDEALARVAAARVSHWLEYLVLPGQHILVDAPHLVARYPSLLLEDKEDINSWNKTVSLGNEANGIKIDILEPFRFAQNNWLSRPAWYWHSVSQCEAIVEVQDPWSAKSPGFVFCEDTSTFAPKDQVQEFVSDLGFMSSPFTRRFVKKLEDVVYKPTVRFSI